MTPRNPPECSAKSIDRRPFMITGNALPPRDPDEGDEDDEEPREAEEDEPPIVREPDED
jgi:hypothetical protein